MEAIHINDETTIEDAQNQYFQFFKALGQKCGTEMPDEQIKKRAIDAVSRMHGHINCPEVHHKVNLMKCHINCPFGHMCECHYPYTCSDPKAKCQHYQTQEDPIEF
jgi:hypothetical protein